MEKKEAGGRGWRMRKHEEGQGEGKIKQREAGGSMGVRGWEIVITNNLTKSISLFP